MSALNPQVFVITTDFGVFIAKATREGVLWKFTGPEEFLDEATIQLFDILDDAFDAHKELTARKQSLVERIRGWLNA